MRKHFSRLSGFALLLSAALFLPSLVSGRQDSPPSTSDTVYEIGDGVTAPKAIYQPDPSYTDRARKKKIRGEVYLEFVVTPEGAVRDPKVTTSLDKELDQQALAAVRTWKFEPATKDGKPVAVRVKASVRFNIY